MEVARIKFEKLAENRADQGDSQAIRKRVEKARGAQQKRFAESRTITNSEMGIEEIKRFCALDGGCLALMKSAVSGLHLSARSYYRIIKVARTIADLGEHENISTEHIAEAIQYRFKTE